MKGIIFQETRKITKKGGEKCWDLNDNKGEVLSIKEI